MSGPIAAPTSSAHATRSEATASTSWRRNRGDVATDPTAITRLAAEHFCPACPNAERTTSATARSRSAHGVTTIAFFPEVSASRRRSGRHEAKSRAVSIDPVRTTAPTSGCVTSRLPASPSSDRTTWSRSAGRPWASSAARTAPPATSAHTGVAGAGLRITAEPAASAASAEPSGIATGKFHGGVTTVSRTGSNRAPSTPSSASACSA